MNYRKLNKNILALSFLLLTLPLILNGYPIVSGDTLTYTHSYTNFNSFFDPPISRPVFYGLFIFLSSVGKSSLFYVALFQDLLMAYLISKIYPIKKISFSLLFLLAYLPISYIAILSNTIIPDIWLSIGYLAVYILIFTDNKKSPLFYLLLFSCGAFAPANGVIILISTFLLWIVMGLKNKKEITLIIFTIILSLFFDSYDNYVSYRIFSPIAASNTFWVARLLGDDLAQDQIIKLCAQDKYKNTSPCINKSQYLDRNDQEFEWGSYNNSFDPWNLENQKFFSTVKNKTIANNLAEFSYDVFNSGIETLALFPKNLNDIYGGYKRDFDYHQHPWQKSSAKSFSYFPVTNIGIVFAVILTLIDNIRYIKRNFSSFIILSVYTASCIIINAFLDGGLSVVDYRYNVKGLGVILILYCFILASQRFSINPKIGNPPALSGE